VCMYVCMCVCVCVCVCVCECAPRVELPGQEHTLVRDDREQLVVVLERKAYGVRE
jgi:hypothetical protein